MLFRSWLRYSAAARFVEVAEATSLFRIPAEPERLQERAHAHAPSFLAVRRKLLIRSETPTLGTSSPQAPKVSVAIVNYNAGRHLERCLKSLAGQTETDFEVFVVDNASTDSSFAAVIRPTVTRVRRNTASITSPWL